MIRELDRVRLLAAHECDDGVVLPAGSTGTALLELDGGEEWCVEFHPHYRDLPEDVPAALLEVSVTPSRPCRRPSPCGPKPVRS